jgi:hypothetical protein
MRIESRWGLPSAWAADEDLPAGLHVEARADDQLGVLSIPRVGHGCQR